MFQRKNKNQSFNQFKENFSYLTKIFILVEVKNFVKPSIIIFLVGR